MGDELDYLAMQLRQELGQPPPDWEEQQWRRLQHAEFESRPLAVPLRFAGAFAFASMVLVLVYWFAFRPEALVANNVGATDVWLEATSADTPYRAPDGSIIRLEAGGQGRFSGDEDASRFELQQGRGYFEVTKRPDQDWTVVAGRYSVHVIGTRFGVRYEAGDLGVWVDEGQVSVRLPSQPDPVVLQAGERLSFHDDRPTRRVTIDDVNTPTADSASKPADAEPSSASEPPTSTAQRRAPTKASDWHTLYVDGRYAEALAAAKRADFQRLTGSLSARQLIALSAVARLGGDSQLALEALRALESRFPGSASAFDVDFLIGRLHAQQGASIAAIRRLTTYLERGDSARYSLEALGRLIELHTAQGHVAKARPLAERYLQRAPNGPYRRLADSVVEHR